MEEHAPKALNIATSVVITLFIISLVFGLVMIGSRITNSGASKISDITGQLDESTYTNYQGVAVMGDQLIGIIKQFEGSQTGIYVETVAAGCAYIYDISPSDDMADLPDEPFTNSEESTRLMKAQDKTEDTYIAPTKNYVGSVLRNEAGAITGLKFVITDNITD